MDIRSLILMMSLGAGTAMAQTAPQTAPQTGAQTGAQTVPQVVASPFKPTLPPSYDVHIAPTHMAENRTNGAHGPDHWVAEGFRLRDLLSQVYDLPVTRITFTDEALAAQRYDVQLMLPQEESEDAMKRRIQQALSNQLHLAIRPEAKPMDVYVVTVADAARIAARQSQSRGGQISSETNLSEKIDEGAPPSEANVAKLLSEKRAAEGMTLDSISIQSGEIAQFCDLLERDLGKPVIDETGLKESYDIELKRNGLNRDQFFEKIRQEVGLAITPGQRTVTRLVVSRNP